MFSEKVLKINNFGKSDKDKSFGEQAKPTNYLIFFAILCLCQDFLWKLPKLVIIRNACIVYLLNFGTRFSTSLKYLFWQMKEPCGSRFNELSQKTFVYSNLLFTPPLRVCKAYQNCIVALIKIMTASSFFLVILTKQTTALYSVEIETHRKLKLIFA